MGKAYANRKIKSERPESDFYQTPYSLTWKLIELNLIPKEKGIVEPACGEGAIVKPLKEAGYTVVSIDLIRDNYNFLFDTIPIEYLVTNPPFSLWDEFVVHAQELVRKKFIFLGKTNFFGAYQRNERGIWNYLDHVYVFNRQVDYRSPIREDGLFHVGNLITGWFVWDMEKENNGEWKTSILDINPWAKLGQIK